MITITKKTKIPRKFKFPRKYKKAFKKGICGSVSGIFVKPNLTEKDKHLVLEDFMHLLKTNYHMKKYNLKNYKGCKKVFTTKGK